MEEYFLIILWNQVGNSMQSTKKDNKTICWRFARYFFHRSCRKFFYLAFIRNRISRSFLRCHAFCPLAIKKGFVHCQFLTKWTRKAILKLEFITWINLFSESEKRRKMSLKEYLFFEGFLGSVEVKFDVKGMFRRFYEWRNKMRVYWMSMKLKKNVSFLLS